MYSFQWKKINLKKFQWIIPNEEQHTIPNDQQETKKHKSLITHLWKVITRSSWLVNEHEQQQAPSWWCQRWWLTYKNFKKMTNAKDTK
jgi:hypothetical protein